MPIFICAFQEYSVHAPVLASRRSRTESVNHIDMKDTRRFPFRLPLRAQVEYSAANSATKAEVSAVVVGPFVDESGKQETRPMAVVPASSRVATGHASDFHSQRNHYDGHRRHHQQPDA